MNSLAIISIVIAILAVANARPGGLTGVPIFSSAIVPQTIIAAPSKAYAPAPIVAQVPIKTTVYKAEPALIPNVKGLVGSAPIKTTVYNAQPSILIPSVKGLVGSAPIKTTVYNAQPSILIPSVKGPVESVPISTTIVGSGPGLKGLNSGILGGSIWV